MTRIVRPGEEKHAHRPLHPILEKVPAVKGENVEALSAYFYDNPRSVEIIEWINDNLDPVFAPGGLALYWWGIKPLDDDGDHVLMTVVKKNIKDKWPREDRLFDELGRFKKTLFETFPEAATLVSVVV